jgi:predicted RND superfamily exporter protein
MWRRIGIVLLVLGIVVSALGLFRLRFDTDILSMLPGELPEVKGLKAFQQSFAREDELVMLIEGGEQDEGSLSTAAESLAKQLERDGVAKRARWQPRWKDDPQGLSELLAYLWLNGETASAKHLTEKLSPGKSAETIQSAMARVATAMEGRDMVMQAHDPFGFLDQPAVQALASSVEQGSEAFESADGRAHLIFVDAPSHVRGYQAAGEWLDRVRASITTWQSGEGKGLAVRMTGEPVFAAEIGGAMEKDLSGSIGITLGLIALLFWWMQRRLSLLAGLIGILVLVFAVALGLAGWFYGKLSIMALSSAEILIGLATDYGLVICQEAKLVGHNRKALLRASARPVLCGALTTTVVFLALNLGGFPGMAQLGSIVAIGLTAAGLMMVVLYLPFVAKFGVNRVTPEDEARWLPRKKVSWAVTGGLLVAAIALLAWLGLPGANFDSKIVRPRHSVAMESLERVEEKFPAWNPRALRLVVEAPDDATMLKRLAEARQRFDRAKGEGPVEDFVLPEGWWPDPAAQSANRASLTALSGGRERLLQEADQAGFSEEGVALGKSVLEALDTMLRKPGVAFPESEAAREVMRLFLVRHEAGGGLVLGSAVPAAGMDLNQGGYEKLRPLSGDGIWLSGWELFKPALAGLVDADLVRMLVPMGLLLIGMMAVIFRRVRDVGLALFTMVVSTVLLLALMRVFGMKWNFVNLMATPLLLGTGIDYAIHVTLTLRRTGGCFKELWNGTGKALLFCAASNVIGFGSLCFSSSEAMTSLGGVAVIGILLSMAVSLFLLPGWSLKREKEPQMNADGRGC